MKNLSHTPIRHPAFSTFLVFLCCFLCSFLSISTATAQLSGTYTIGGEDGDYASFSEALNAIETDGRSGQLTFRVRPGTYNEQLNLDNFGGVTFEGETADSTDVVLEYDGDYVVLIENHSGFTFRHMTISGSGQAFRIRGVEGKASSITLENNILKAGGTVINAYSEGRENTSGGHVYRNNMIISEGHGISKTRDTHIYDFTGGRITDSGLEISGNIMQVKGTGISLHGQEGVEINHNQITVGRQSTAVSASGMNLNFVYVLRELNHNLLIVEGADASGININGENLPRHIHNNQVRLPGGGTGMDIGFTNHAWFTSMLVSNNMISVKGNEGSTGIRMHSSGDAKFYFNSVLIYGDDADSKAFYVPATRTDEVQLLNNIFANQAGGYAIYAGFDEHYEEYPLIVSSDYNVFYSSGEILAHWNDRDAATLNEWQNFTDFDKNSVVADPQFESEEELIPAQPAIDNEGLAIEEVRVDFFGKMRNDPPDIGAVEFEEEEPGTALAGNYTIGGESPDYESFNEALEALEEKGLSGAVTFMVRPGTYEEQLILGEYTDNSCELPVIFEGESGDSTAVVLSYSGYALRIEGADGVVFRNMTISGINITEGSNCITLDNNRITGSLKAVSGPGELANNHHIYRNNSIINNGIRKIKEGDFDPANPDFDEGLEISGNVINTFSRTGIEINAQRDYFINNNKITIGAERDGDDGIRLINSWYGKEIRGNVISIESFYGEGYGISTENGIAERVSENRVGISHARGEKNPFTNEQEIGTGGGTGLLVSAGKTESGEILIANNKLSINGYDRHSSMRALIGIHIEESHSGDNIFKVYHNDITVFGYKTGYNFGPKSQANAFVAEAVGENSLHILNNIFHKYNDAEGGFALNIRQPSSVVVSDYNYFENFKYQNSDDDLVWGDETASSLEEWQALTGMDMHSITTDAVAGAGIKVAEVDIDIEGKSRPDPPTIGAVELEEVEPAVVVNAGSDKVLNMPINILSLRGTAQVQDGRFISFRWEKVSGPSVTMSGQQTANVNLTDLEAGEYVFRFTATDDQGRTGSDEMALTIKDNFQLPVVNAGSDRTITLPTNAISLSGIAIANGGSFMSFRWEKVSGPEVTMEGEKTANVRLSVLQEGEYVFSFSATDSRGVTASDEMTLIVNPAEQTNLPPVVNAGSDKTMTLPNNSISLRGTGFDPDGRFVAFLWEKVSGPSVTMDNARTANVNLSDLQEGVYVFRFSGTDNDGATASDEMTLTVNAGPALASQSNSISVAAYPNTFQHHINVSVQRAQPEEYQVEVYDMLGKVYYRGSFAGGSLPEQAFRIDLSDVNMEEGMYLIRIENRSRSVQETLKVVKGH